MMTQQQQGKWIQCVVDSDYEIFDQYPHQIRRKSNKRIVKEGMNNVGYVQCALSGRTNLKHRIIAMQFVPNPNNYDCVDHINRMRTDNRSQNLRWVTGSENNRNRTSSTNGDVQYEYFDDLPKRSIPVTVYGKHHFNNYYFNLLDNRFYMYTGANYRRLHINYNSAGNAFVYAYDTNNKKSGINYLKFKRLNHIA